MFYFFRCPFWSLVGCLSVCTLSLAQTAPTNMQLFLLMGQSNMAGRGEISEQDLITHPRIWMLTQDNTWVPARDPVHYDRTYAGVGLASQFARDLAAAQPNVSIGLIPTAVGGSKISEWAPGSLHLNNAIARARAASANGTLAGILWHQGESDATTSGASTYLAKFAALIGRLRADLDAFRVPVVAGELGLFRAEHATLNPTLARIPERIPLAGFARADGLNHKGDSLHFDSPSLYEFGHRYIMQWATVGAWLNFEAEHLSHQLSGGSIFLAPEVQASDGQFLRFQPSSFGQYIEFTLPAVPAGTYAVKMRYHRHPSRGRCGVSVDGVPLGAEIDQTASTTYSTETSLGTVTFGLAGNHQFRVTATGSSTSSKYVSIDSVVLVRQNVVVAPTLQTAEAEKLAETHSSGTIINYGEQAASGGRWLKFFPSAFGDFIEFTLPNVPAGNYTLKLRDKRDPDRGRCSVSWDGVPVGIEIDQYRATAEFREISIGTVTAGSTGNHTVRLTASSSAGTSKNLAIDAFVLVPEGTLLLEAEAQAKTVTGGSTTLTNEARASGGRWIKFFPTAFGQSVTFTLAGIPAGSYEVRFAYKRDPDRGRCTVRLNGQAASGEIDQFASVADYRDTVVGTITAGATGDPTIQITASSSAGSSKNLSIDAFILVPR
jgi:hypothetical protein